MARRREKIMTLSQQIPSIFSVLVLATCSAFAQRLESAAPATWHDDRIDPVWQYSIPAPTIPDRRALLWIPPDCDRVVGVVVALQNMLEEPLFVRKAFRDACAENSLAILLLTSGRDRVGDDDKNLNHPKRSYLDILLNPNSPKDTENPSAAGHDLQTLLDTFAAQSGYPELKYAPLMPVGHSSAGPFVWHFYRSNPSRFFAMMPFKTAIKDDGPEGIPIFNIESEWFDFQNNMGNTSTTDGAIRQQKNVRHKLPGSAFSFYVDVGSGHCNVSDDSIPMIAMFLKKVVALRIPQVTGSQTSVTGPVKLNAVILKSGYVIPIDGFGKANVEPIAFKDYTGDPGDAFWYFDKEMAETIQHHIVAQYAKKPQMINFVKDDGSLPTTGGTFGLGVKAIDDAGTFKVEAKYIDHLDKPSFYPDGTTFEKSGQPIYFRLVGGGGIQVGPNLFRAVPEIGPLMPQSSPWGPTITAYTLGNDEFQPIEKPGHVWVSMVSNDGAPQKITFPLIDDHRANDEALIPLKATSSAGLPIQYILGGGPVRLTDDRQSLMVDSIPKHAKFPMRVLIGAFQWGRREGQKVQSAGPVFREFSITRTVK